MKKDNRKIQESVRKNEKQADDPVGSEANPKALQMGRAIRGGGLASGGHGEQGDEP